MPSPKKRQKPSKKAGRKSEAGFNPQKALELLFLGSSQWFLLLLAGFTLVALGILSLPNFQSQVPGCGIHLPLLFSYLAIPGFLLLAAAFRAMPAPNESIEISKAWASVWFSFFFILTLYTRFGHPETPEATFWYDDLVVTGDVRHMLDFHQYPLLFPWGQREPFFPYLNAFLWLFMPHADGVFINRLSSALVDLGTCWGLYLLGRTVSGRRAGLFLMAFYAVSKPFMVYCYFGYGANTCELSTVWMMVFFFRLLAKPVFRRFVYLGIALGFGAYTYVPARVWTPFILGCVWLWIIYGFYRAKPKNPWVWGLLGGGITAWAFLFLSKNNLLESDWSWVSFFSHPAVGWLVFLALMAAYARVGLTMKKRDEFSQRAFGWATLALIAFLLSAPFFFHPLYASHLSDTSALHMNKKLSIGSDALHLIWANTVFFFTMMFGQGPGDLGTYPMWVICFFDYLPEAAMVVGLAFFAARPSWKKLFVGLCLGVGMLPFILTNHAHSARALSVVGPLFLMAGWGTDYLWRLFTREAPHPLFNKAAFVLLLGLWGWNAHWSNSIVWDNWMVHKSNDALIYGQVDANWRQYRVVIASHNPDFESVALTMLCDQREVWSLNDPNPIYLEPGESSKDILLIFWGYDQKMEDRLKADFPDAQYTIVPSWAAERPRFIEKVLIPFSSLSETPGKLFYIVRTPHEYWRRRFYCENYGVTRGLVWWDDRIPLLNDPFPSKLNVWMSGQADGEINLPAGGDYSFRGETASDLIDLSIDGKSIIHFVPQEGVVTAPRESIHLAAGVHPVSYKTSFQHGPKFPRVIVTPPGGPDWFLGEAKGQ